MHGRRPARGSCERRSKIRQPVLGEDRLAATIPARGSHRGSKRAGLALGRSPTPHPINRTDPIRSPRCLAYKGNAPSRPRTAKIVSFS
jgi:hypothetical protein